MSNGNLSSISDAMDKTIVHGRDRVWVRTFAGFIVIFVVFLLANERETVFVTKITVEIRRVWGSFSFPRILIAYEMPLRCNLIANITDQVAGDSRECSLGFATLQGQHSLQKANCILTIAFETFYQSSNRLFFQLPWLSIEHHPGRAVDWLKLKLFFHSPTNTIKFAKLFVWAKSPTIDISAESHEWENICTSCSEQKWWFY